MNLAPLINAIGGFAGGFANSYNPSQNDLGNALASLYGGDNSGSGQSSSPMGGSSYNPVPIFSSGQSQPYQGQTNTGLPTAAGQTQPAAPMGTGPLAAQIATQAKQPGTAQAPPGQGGIGSDYAAQPPQAQQGSSVGTPGPGPQQAQAQPRGAPTGSAAELGKGPLTLGALISTLRQRNPHISGAHLAEAVRQALPILNAQGLEQYRGIELQLRQQSMENLQEDRKAREEDRKAAAQERSREYEGRMKEKQTEFVSRMKAAGEKLQQAKTIADAKQNYRALSDGVKQKLEATRTWANATYGQDTPEAKQAIEQAGKDAKAAQQNLDDLYAQRKSELGTNDKENTKGSQEKTQINVDQERKNAEAAIKNGVPADAVKKMFKERTGQDFGQ